MRPAEGDHLAGATRPSLAGHDSPAGPAPRSAKPLNEQALLHELWQISHFGWIREVTIRRGLAIAGQEIHDATLANCLGRLLERGWVEPRHSDSGTGHREWRLTDSGRNAR